MVDKNNNAISMNRVTLMRVTTAMQLKWSHSEPPLHSDKESTIAKIVLSSISITHAFGTSKTPTTPPANVIDRNDKENESVTDTTSKTIQLKCIDENKQPQTIIGLRDTITDDWYVLAASGHDSICIKILRLLIYASNSEMIHFNNFLHDEQQPSAKRRFGCDQDNLYYLWKSVCHRSKTDYQSTNTVGKSNRRVDFITQCLYDLYLTVANNDVLLNHSIFEVKDNIVVQSFERTCRKAWRNPGISLLKLCIVSPAFQTYQSAVPSSFKPIHLNALQSDYRDEFDSENAKIGDIPDEIILSWYFRWTIVPRVKEWNENDAFFDNIYEIDPIDPSGTTLSPRKYTYLAMEYGRWRLFALVSNNSLPTNRGYRLHSRDEEQFLILRQAARRLIQQYTP